MLRSLPVLAALALVASAPGAAWADGPALVQTDTLGAPVWTHNFTAHADTTIADQLVLSEFVGLHDFVTPTVRLGMNLQVGELIYPAPPAGGSRLDVFALLPQIGWIFHRPFFAAFVPTIVLRAGGKNRLDLGAQLVFGAAFPIGHGLAVTPAVEIPYYFKLARRISITPLLGIAWKL